MDTQTTLTRRAEARIPHHTAIVGAGRLGTALAAGLRAAGAQEIGRAHV